MTNQTSDNNLLLVFSLLLSTIVRRETRLTPGFRGIAQMTRSRALSWVFGLIIICIVSATHLTTCSWVVFLSVDRVLVEVLEKGTFQYSKLCPNFMNI